jgi:hypothetical protein
MKATIEEILCEWNNLPHEKFLLKKDDIAHLSGEEYKSLLALCDRKFSDVSPIDISKAISLLPLIDGKAAAYYLGSGLMYLDSEVHVSGHLRHWIIDIYLIQIKSGGSIFDLSDKQRKALVRLRTQ